MNTTANTNPTPAKSETAAKLLSNLARNIDVNNWTGDDAQVRGERMVVDAFIELAQAVGLKMDYNTAKNLTVVLDPQALNGRLTFALSYLNSAQSMLAEAEAAEQAAQATRDALKNAGVSIADAVYAA